MVKRRNESEKMPTEIVRVIVDDGEVKGLEGYTAQGNFFFVPGTNFLSGSIHISPENLQVNLQQAQEVYNAVKDLLKVDERLKDYVPRFSYAPEITLASILGLDNICDLNKLKPNS